MTSLVTNFTSARPFEFCIVLLVIIASFSLLVGRTSTGIIMPETPALDVSMGPADFPLLADSPETVELNMWKMCLTADFWLLFFCHFAVIGSGVTTLNNLSEIVISFENLLEKTTIEQADLPYAKYTVTFVALFSVFNTSGRLVVGMLSDYYRHYLSRSSWLFIMAVMMAMSQLYFLFTNIPGMFVGIVLVGLAYGGTFALVPTLTSEFFGLKNFGANYGVVGIAPAIGSELLSVLIAGKLNDFFRKEHYITIISKGVSNKHCIGEICYRYTFIVTVIICALAILSSFLLSRRQRKKKMETINAEVSYVIKEGKEETDSTESTETQ